MSRNHQFVAITLLCTVLVAGFAPGVRAGTSLGQVELAAGGSVEWSEVSGETSLDQTLQFLDRAGSVTHTVRLQGFLDQRSGKITHRFEIDGQLIEVDPEAHDSSKRLRDFFGSVSDARLKAYLDDALEVLPAGSKIRDSATSLAGALDPPTRDRDGADPQDISGDCYVDCVEQEKQSCHADCGSSNPWNPCVSICYIAISIGCGIGCS